ncbi:MAG: hypothetical protein EXR79_16945 [Myxococcales bacterium]|nr:hypothetical protein [Myxococcales bacterium]
MKTITRLLLMLAVAVAFSGSLDELRARRYLSPGDMHKWLEFRELLPLPAYDHGDVAATSDQAGIAAPTASSDSGRATGRGV